MERIPNNNENGELSMEEFREEIAEIKRAEETGEQKSANFLETKESGVIDPAFLGEEELELYRKLKEKTLTSKEFEKYTESLRKRSDFESQAHRGTIVAFAGFMGNQLLIQSYTEGSWHD